MIGFIHQYATYLRSQDHDGQDKINAEDDTVVQKTAFNKSCHDMASEDAVLAAGLARI